MYRDGATSISCRRAGGRDMLELARPTTPCCKHMVGRSGWGQITQTPDAGNDEHAVPALDGTEWTAQLPPHTQHVRSPTSALPMDVELDMRHPSRANLA